MFKRFRWFIPIALLLPLGVFVVPAGFSPRFPDYTPHQEDSASCISCHGGQEGNGIESMHAVGDEEVGLTCVSCHGGDGAAYEKDKAHVQPRNKDVFASSANPPNSYAVINHESQEFIRFMNPGDLRVAHNTCGTCHTEIYQNMLKSIMSTGALVAQAAFYNNGVLGAKRPVFGEGYMPDGTPAITHATMPNQQQGLLEIDKRQPNSLVPKVEPLPRFAVIPALDHFRVLEDGNNGTGTRARGTDFRTAGAGLAVQKTRLNDPTLWFIGANASGGDYRQSGCTGCHVTYANDRDTLHAGPEVTEFYRAGGKTGYSGSADPMIPKDEIGHPVKHKMTVGVPVAQCLTCHHHQGNAALETYTGSMWWDQETDAENLLSAHIQRDYYMDEAVRRTLYDRDSEFKDIQFTDHNGHRWNFRKVYIRDKAGNLLDDDGNIIPDTDPDKFSKAVHARDIHMETGMHCIDCHTEQDVHGDGRLWGATPDPIEIACIDCHGTYTERATLVTSGINGGNDMGSRLSGSRTQFGDRQFVVRDGTVIQRSKMYEDLEWEVPQLVDLLDPNSSNYNELAAKAKMMRRDGSMGDSGTSQADLAHSNNSVECFTCHSAWNTGCYGCHLSLNLNSKQDAKHYEGATTKGLVEYNPQVVRTDNFLIGRGASSKSNKFSPMRSASSVVVTVRALGRQTAVHQQPTISAAGYSGYAFAPNTPHTVRGKQTRQCTDCHVAEDNTNNAWLASLVGQGTNSLNFFGEYAYLATGGGLEVVKVTEGSEPQPAIGSHLHSILHPDSYAAHTAGGRQLKTGYKSGAKDAQDVAAIGEYVFVADGKGGLQIYDRANVDNKNVAQRVPASTNSRFGERLHVKTSFATGIGLPSNVPLNLERRTNPEFQEKPIAELFRYAYISDLIEGLVVVDINTLFDANPRNNFLERKATFDANGRLRGATGITIGGNYAYITSETSGLQIVNISNPRSPRWVAEVGVNELTNPRSVAIQFRYAFVTDAEGLKVIDVSDPEKPRFIPGATLSLADARDVYPVRSYAYVAGGREGLVIVDIANPEQPKLVESFTAGGQINDATQVTTGAINASLFAFLADGRNGLRVIRMIGPPDTKGHLGFSPQPNPKLIASYRTGGAAVAIAEGGKRDRAVDESGNQIGVFGRIGSGPLSQEDVKTLLEYQNRKFTVRDDGTVIFQN